MNGIRVAVIGGNGLLGQHVAHTFSAESEAPVVIADLHPTPCFTLGPRMSYATVDVTDRTATKSWLAAEAPSVVINCAAMTGVDACETERERAWRVNVRGVGHLVEACRKIDAHLVQMSSDYVFDGRGGPYTEFDTPRPINYYGKTKLAGENMCRTGGIRYTIVRSMVLYGVGETVRDNFVTWVLRNVERNASIDVATDQVGNATLVDDLALSIFRIVERKREGVYHVAGPDIISRFAFAQTIARAFQLDATLVHPTLTASLHQRAARPLASGLVTLKAQTELGVHMCTAEEGLRAMRLQIERAHR